MSKEHLIAFVLELYQNNKQTKQYIEYLLDPNEKEMLEKYRKIIIYRGNHELRIFRRWHG